jgi:hypothetical protein
MSDASKRDNRFPSLVAVKLSRPVATELRRRAAEDDRTLSSFVRRLLTEAVGKDSSGHATS